MVYRRSVCGVGAAGRARLGAAGGKPEAAVLSEVKNPSDNQRGSLAVFERQWRAMGAEVEFGPQERLFAERKIEALLDILPPPPATVLEVGCGSAEVTAALAVRGYRCIALDASSAALAVARRRLTHAGTPGTLVAGNAYALPFLDDHFDVLTSFGLLEHFADVDRVMTEMVRVVRPGGFFFADIVPARFSVQVLGTLWNAAVRLVYYSAKGRPRDGMREMLRLFRPDFYENHYSLACYRRMLHDVGLRGVVIRGNRPVPLLTVPAVVERGYVAALRRFLPLWRRFDGSGSRLAAWWGAGWWALGGQVAAG